MTPETMHCPTCRAAQAWSDTCRRCKSDLRLLRELGENYSALRSSCLVNVRNNRLREALEQARHCLALRDNVETRRLLAVCELLNGHWGEARFQASQLVEERNGNREA